MKFLLDNMRWPLVACSILAFSYLVLANTNEVKKMIYVEGFTKGSATDIRVNDIPLGKIIPNGQMYTKQVERHLLPGKNIISIIPENETGAAAIRLSIYPEGTFVDGRGGEEIGKTQTEKGKSVSLTFELDDSRPRWQWLDADVITSTSDTKDAEQFVKQAYTYLANADAEHFTPLLNPLFIDLAKHDASISAKDRLEGFKAKLQTRKGQPIWQFTNIEDLDIVLTPIANGHLIDVRRKDGSAVFRTAQDNKLERITYYNIIGRKKGKWAFYY